MSHALLLALCLSCGGEFGRETCNGSFRVDPTIVDAPVAERRWNAFLGSGRTHFRLSTTEGKCRMVNVPIKGTAFGHYLPDNGEIQVDWAKVQGYGAPLREAVLLHEMGHSLGLPHLAEGQDGIMTPGGLEFSAWDRAAVERLGL